MINIKPSDINALVDFETNLEVSNILMNVFRNSLIEKDINTNKLNREQWVYLLANWLMEKSGFKTSTGLWYLPYHEKEYNYDYLINFYEISIEDINNMKYEINKLKNDMLNTKSIELIEKAEI